MPRKEKKGRRAYLNDIKMNESGKYVYEGTCYFWNEEGESRCRVLVRLWILCGVLVVAAVAAGCIPAPGMGNCIYLVLPYALEVIAAVGVCWGLGRLTFGGDPLREYVYQATAEKIPGRSALAAVLAVLTAAGEIIYVIQNGMQDDAGMFALCLILEGAAAVSAVYLRRVVSGLSWDKRRQ